MYQQCPSWQASEGEEEQRVSKSLHFLQAPTAGHSSFRTILTLKILRVLEKVTNVVILQMWWSQDEEAKVFKIALHASIFPMTNHLIGCTAIGGDRDSAL